MNSEKIENTEKNEITHQKNESNSNFDNNNVSIPNENKINDSYQKITNETQTSSNHQKKSNKKLFYLIIISSAICAIIIIILLCTLLPKKKSNSKNYEIPSQPEEPEIEPSIEEIKEDSKDEPKEENENEKFFKISSLFFNSSKKEIIKTNLDGIPIDKKTRRLDENENVKEIKSDYLFTIVSEPNLENDYFVGFVIILSRKEILNDEEISFFDESNHINENDKNYKAIMKIKFKNDGSIIEKLFQKGLNGIYMNEINDAISCVIPNFIKKRNLEQLNEEETFFNNGENKNENSFWYSKTMKGKLGLDNNALLNSEYDGKINITLQNNVIKQSVLEKKIIIKNGEYQKPKNFNFDEGTISFGDELNDDITIKGYIDSIENNSTQTLNFVKDEGKNLAEKYKNKLKKLEFKSEKEHSLLNQLRVLSNKEYEQQIQKNFNNSKKLKEVEFTQSMQFPLVFKYEIFKSDILINHVALRAIINWIPAQGVISFKVFFYNGTSDKEIEELSHNVQIGNYSNVVISHKNLIMTIISYLNDEILGKIDENYVQLSSLIESHLKSYGNNLENVLEPLSLLYNVYFKNSLEKFKEEILNYAKNEFENLFNDTNIISILEDIENSLINNEEDNLKNFILKSEFTLKNIINKHKLNIINLEDSVEKFINNSINSINDLNEDQKIGIDFYYRVKEIFYRIDVMMDSFSDNLINALDSEFLLLENYVEDEIYLGKIDSLIDNVEVVWDIFKNNEILKETISTSDEIVNKLENVRKKYENVKNAFLNKIKESYEKFKNIQIKNEFNEIQNIKKNLNEEEKILIDLIKEKVLYITNYENYNEDIKKVTKIENEISTLKLNAYETFIYNKLNEINSDLFFSSNSIKNIKNEIENEIKNLDENKLNKILTKFNEISSKNNIEKIINEIKNEFSSDYLKTLVENYYNFVIENGIENYSILADEIINNTLKNYLSEPVELINKFKSLSNVEKNTEKENENIQKFVTEKMKNILNEIISKIKNIITTETNLIKTKINSYKLKNIFESNSTILINDLTTKTSNYLSSFDFSLGLKSTIEEQEKNINKKISEISENLNENFYNLFCNENEKINKKCPNEPIKKLDAYDKYYFQVSKFRDALNHLTLLQPFINDVINDDNLNELSVEKFVNLYKNPENFDVNLIAEQVKKFLEKLKNEGIENTKNNVDSLKEIIKSSFISGYNLNEEIFENFFKNLFIIQNDLEEKFDILFSNVKKEARIGYQKDLEFYKNAIFFYNISKTNLEIEFNKTWDDYLNQLETKKNGLFDKLKLTEEFSNKIYKNFEKKIFDDVNKYETELKLNLSKNSQNCYLLDNYITLTEIADQAITELKNNLSTTIEINLSSKLKEALENYNAQFNLSFKNLHNNIKNQYRHLYDNYHNMMSEQSSYVSTNEINNLTDGIKNGFENGIKLCLQELEKLLEVKTFNELYNDDSNIETLLNNIFYNINLVIPNTIKNIDTNIDNLKLICDKEFIREKDSFKDEILENIKKGFNYTIINFMNGSGKSYLNEIFLNDYEFKIASKLDYIKKQTLEIDEYLKLIIKSLFDVDSYLTDSVDEVYNQLINYIKDGINLDEINAKLIKKINQFKFDSSEKIVDYFKTYTLNILSNESFLSLFSEQVKILLPTNVPFTLVLDFSIIYKDLLESSYLSTFKQNYHENIINERDKIIEELEKMKFQRALQVGKLGQGMKSSSLASNIVEYNTLNATLSKMNIKFNFDLTDDKKVLVDNLLLNETIIDELENIPYDYNSTFNEIQNSIIENVKLTLDLSKFKEKIEELENNINQEDLQEEAENIKEDFFNNLTLLYENLENEVKKNYANQSNNETKILPIDNKRRLYDNDIEIESIQAILNLIDIKIANLTQNITNSEEMIKISNKLNKINNAIDVQLINLDNTMESYLKYSRFYLTSKETLDKYQQNITKIYKEVDKILTNFSNTQIDSLHNVFNTLNNYKDPYYNDIKPEIVEKINNVTKDVSYQLINNYIEDKNEYEEKLYTPKNESKTESVSTVLDSSRINNSIDVENIVLQWGYNLKKDPSNYKVYLEVYAGGYSNSSISFSNEFYETLIEGNLGKGTIGMKIENDFSIDRVFINYYTKYENNTHSKSLYDYTIVDRWDLGSKVPKNEDYCWYILKVENENLTEVNLESIDLDYYKNSSYYIFKSYYEENLCMYAHYFYGSEETRLEFNSSIVRTV